MLENNASPQFGDQTSNVLLDSPEESLRLEPRRLWGPQLRRINFETHCAASRLGELRGAVATL